jgi:hypothetical protein
MNLAFRGNWKQGFLGLQAAPKKINGAGHRGPLPRCRAQPDWYPDERKNREADGQHVLEAELADIFRLLRAEGDRFARKS